MRFAESVKLLAADAATQTRILAPVPETSGVRDFVRNNAVYRMAWLYHRSFGVYDETGGNEGLDSWLARTELPEEITTNRDSPFWNSAERLWTVIDMIIRMESMFLYTAQGLRKAREWKLVRYLAFDTCKCAQWTPTLTETSFERLWTGLGGGMIEIAWPTR